MADSEKQKINKFINLAGDFLGSGYRGEYQEQFEIDEEIPAIENGSVVEQPKAAEYLKVAEQLSDAEAKDNTPPESDDSLELIASQINSCRNCPLGNSRLNAAPGEGVSSPLVMVIGEGPGKEEDEQGRPFVGRAGQLLDKMLSAIDLSRETNCFIANIVKCRPPENRDPYPEEAAACAQFLNRQIIQLKPKFILAAGRIAAQTLLKTTEPIGKLRGKFKEFYIGDLIIPTIVTYHPAALLRFEEYKRPAWEDLKLLRSKIDE